jgi:hypothetical protein
MPESELLPVRLSRRSISMWYALLTANCPLVVSPQINLSYMVLGLIAILHICSTISGGNTCSMRGMLYQLLSMLINSLIVAAGCISCE